MMNRVTCVGIVLGLFLIIAGSAHSTDLKTALPTTTISVKDPVVIATPVKEPTAPIVVSEPFAPILVKEPTAVPVVSEPVVALPIKEPISPVVVIKEPVAPVLVKEPVTSLPIKVPVSPIMVKEPVSPVMVKTPVIPVQVKEPVTAVRIKEPVAIKSPIKVPVAPDGNEKVQQQSRHFQTSSNTLKAQHDVGNSTVNNVRGGGSSSDVSTADSGQELTDRSIRDQAISSHATSIDKGPIADQVKGLLDRGNLKEAMDVLKGADLSGSMIDIVKGAGGPGDSVRGKEFGGVGGSSRMPGSENPMDQVNWGKAGKGNAASSWSGTTSFNDRMDSRGNQSIDSSESYETDSYSLSVKTSHRNGVTTETVTYTDKETGDTTTETSTDGDSPDPDTGTAENPRDDEGSGGGPAKDETDIAHIDGTIDPFEGAGGKGRKTAAAAAKNNPATAGNPISNWGDQDGNSGGGITKEQVEQKVKNNPLINPGGN